MFMFGIPEIADLFRPGDKNHAPPGAPPAAEGPSSFMRFFGKLMGNHSPDPNGAVGPDGKPIDNDYAQHWVDTQEKKKTPPPNTAPVAKEVEGAPTGSQRHADDDDIVIEKTEKSKSTTIGDGAATHTRTTTTSTSSGGHTESDAKSKSATVSANGVKLGSNKTHEVKDEESGTKDSNGKHIEVGASHVELGKSRSTEATQGDATVKRDSSTAVSVGNGEIGIKRGKSNQTVVKDVVIDEHGQPKEVVRTEGKATQVGGGVGTDHASANAASTTTHADGKQTTVSGGASANWENGQVAANAGYSKKDADGKTKGVSGGGGVDMGANGIQGIDANASVTHGKVSVSAKGGIKVEVSEPTKTAAGWQVTWKKTSTIGGGASGGEKAKIGASGSASNFELGSRVFATEADAKKYHDQHDSITADTGKSATTLDGAFDLAVGESRGSGSSSQVGGEASVEVEGASLGGGISKTGGDQIEVRRASLNVFEVTVSNASGSSKNISGGGMGVTAKAGTSKAESHLATVRFDLTTTDGKKAFEEFCKTRQVPEKGGQLIATEDGKEKGHFDGLAMGPLGESSFKGRSWEKTRKDEQGKHEEYGGQAGEDFTYTRLGHWLGGKDQHKSYSLVGKQENDVEASSYIVEGEFSGESAISNMDGIYRMTGRDSPTRDRDSITDDMRSGKWKVSAELSKERVDQYVDWIVTTGYQFDYGAIGDLQTALRGAKSSDDKMRAVTEFISQEDGKGMKNLGVQELSFDVELSDDKGQANPDFPGRSGRLELAAKAEKYTALLDASGKNGPLMLHNVEGEIKALKERRAHVADPKKYQDLPDQMRDEELAKIDAFIGEFSGMRDRAAIEAVKVHGGEDMVGIVDRQSADADHKGERPKDPVQAQLYDMRDEISIAQLELARFQQETAAAVNATDHASHLGKFRESPGDAYRRQSKAYDSGNVDEKNRKKGEKEINELRLEFLAALDKPQVALQLGGRLRTKLNSQVELAQSANDHYRESARAMRDLKYVQAGDEKDAKFWQELAEEDRRKAEAAARAGEIEMPAMDLRKKN